MKVIEITESVKMLGFQLSNERAVNSDEHETHPEWNGLTSFMSGLT